jgi:hypothetical protein
MHNGYIRINEKVDYHIQNFDEPFGVRSHFFLKKF